MKRFFPVFLLLMMIQINAQTREELLAIKNRKADSVSKLKQEMDSIQRKIDTFPGWRFKTFGTIGGSVSGHKNWFTKRNPNSSVGHFGININAFATYKKQKYFWKNKLNVNISWHRHNDRGNFSMGTDIFMISSLFGRTFAEEYAFSALGQYSSSVFLERDFYPKNNFNNPGYLDLGIGGTWTPIIHLMVVFHPLNYNYIFHHSKKRYISSIGSKMVIDYTKRFGDIDLITNLAIFLSYKSSDYSNFLWVNTVSYTIWKKLGLAIDFGLRGNKQEAYNYEMQDDPDLELADTNNKLQSYWLFGLNFKLD